MFEISNKQIKKFDEFYEKKFLNHLLEKFSLNHKEIFSKQNRSIWEEWLVHNFKLAEKFGFSKKNEMAQLLEICFLSQELNQKIKPDWFIELMSQDQYTCEQKLRILIDLLDNKES
jgi:hypothetical protein